MSRLNILDLRLWYRRIRYHHLFIDVARRWLVLLSILCIAAACGSDMRLSPTVDPSMNPAETKVFFPQQAAVNGERESMTALLVGRLAVVDRCLRVIGTDGTSYLVVWPPGVTLDASETEVKIRDQAGRVVAQSDSEIRLGGGGLDTLADVMSLRQPLREPPPAACPGPYWLVGDIIT